MAIKPGQISKVTVVVVPKPELTPELLTAPPTPQPSVFQRAWNAVEEYLATILK